MSVKKREVLASIVAPTHQEVIDVRATEDLRWQTTASTAQVNREGRD